MTPARWINLGFAGAGLIVFLLTRQILELAWDTLRLPLHEEWVVSLPELIAVALGGIAFWALRKNQKAVSFSTEVVGELSKVTWPLKKETFYSSIIVVVMVGIASVILFLFDTVWGSLVQKIFG